MVKVFVDGKEMEADEQRSLLRVCLDNGIYIPHLCFVADMADPPASCRLCFVQVDGEPKPVPSCKLKPREGMVVRTDTEAVRRLQRTALQLLLSVHNAECRTCPSNKRCPLQEMAKLLGVRLRPKQFEHIERTMTAESENPYFEFVPSRCVLCGKCLYACDKRNGYSLLTLAKRGFNTVVTSYGEFEPSEIPCSGCWACVDICPVSAIFMKLPNAHDAHAVDSPPHEKTSGQPTPQ